MRSVIICFTFAFKITAKKPDVMPEKFLQRICSLALHCNITIAMITDEALKLEDQFGFIHALQNEPALLCLLLEAGAMKLSRELLNIYQTHYAPNEKASGLGSARKLFLM